MRSKIQSIMTVLRGLSRDTHLWCFSVIGGAVLLCVSFFVTPLERDLFMHGHMIGEEDTEIEVVRNQFSYSSILGRIGVEGAVEQTNQDNVTVSIDTLTPVSEGAGISDEEFEALCSIVQCEASSEDVRGRELVANVILNRVADPNYPNNIIDVITSPGQFDPVTNGAFMYVPISQTTKQAVMNVLNGVDSSQGAIYFQKSESKIWGDKEYLFRYGSHSFYK